MLSCVCGRAFNGAKLRACPACSRTAQQIRNLTPSQRAELEAQRISALAAEEARARATDTELQEAFNRERDAYVDDAMKRIEQSVREGRFPSLFMVSVVDSQYTLFGQVGGSAFSSRPLNTLGWDGWEIVGVLPRTTGVPLTNAIGSSSAYGGGIGGIVDGAHLLLKFPVTQELIGQRRAFLERLLSSLFEQERHARLLQPSRVQAPMGTVDRTQAGGAVPATVAGGAFVAFGVTQALEEVDSQGESDGGGFDFSFE